MLSMHVATLFHRIPLLFLLLLGLWTTLPVETVAQVVAGKEFVVALPSFWRRIDGGDPQSFQITVMCSRRTNVTVRWSGPNGGLIDQAVVNAGNRLTVQPPRVSVVDFMQEYEDRKPIEVNQRSFYIVADQPVTVQAFYDHYNAQHGSRTEQYIVPPISTYDTAFMNLTYSGRNGKNTGFLLIAAEDNTTVTFQPTVTWNFPGILPGGPPETVTLNKHQVFQVLSNARGADTLSDLTGTWIKSDKPIGVITFSLQTAAHVIPPPPPGLPPPFDTGGMFRPSPAAEYLPSEAKGGTVFYTAPFLTHDTSQVKVVALQDETAISLNGIQIKTLNRGGWHEFPIGGAAKITSSKPILVMQVARSGNNPIRDADTVLTNRPNGQPDTTIMKIIGNPFMAWVPPVTEYKPTLQWTNPLIPDRKVTRDSLVVYPWHHYALITAPVSAINSVELDGRPVEFQFTHIDGQYASAVVPVLPKQHLLTSTAPISCLAYGYGWDDSYGSTSGEALRSIGIIDIDSLTLTTCDSLVNGTFLLSNIGNNTYRIDSIKADGVEIKNVSRPIAFPTDMPPGRQLDAQFVLRLPRPGTYTGTIRVYTDANNSNILSIPFRIVRDSARLNTPALVDFGPVTADETSFDTLITVKNEGENPLTINTLSFDDTRFAIFQPSSLPITIPPGGSRAIGVRFTPRPGVAEEGTLRIIGEPCFTPIDIPFSGFQGAGALLGVARQIVFPTFLCDAPAYVDTFLVIASIGDEPIEITGNSISGPNGTLFSLRNSLAGRTILPTKTDTLFIRYTPSTFGVHQAQIDLGTTARNVPSPVTISLTGRKDTATAFPNVRTLNFGQRLSCDPPMELRFTLSNGGTVDATVSALEGLEGSPFSIVTALPLSIPQAGTEREIVVRFDPTVDGDFTRTLRVVGGPCGISEEITLRGSRVTPSLSVDEPALNFGTVYLCEGSKTANFTLSNTGPVADTITRVTPAGNAEITLENLNYPIILQPGETRTITMTLTPGTEPNVAASFEFAWGPCNGTTIVSATAFVVDPIVSLSANTIDFAQVNVTGPTGRQTITITNGSTVDRTIGAITINDGTVKLVRPAALPVTLAPGESIELEVEYAPTTPGTLNTTATIAIDGPCPQTETITITGEGIGTVVIDAGLTIEVPETVQGSVDENVKIPILIRDATNLQAAAPTQIDVVLSWRYTMLLPGQAAASVNGMGAQIVSDKITSDRRTVHLAFSGATFPSNGELGSLNAQVLLGDRLQTDLRIDSVGIASPPNRIYAITTDHGTFTLLGICPIDGDRLIEFGGALKLGSVRPNPVNGIAQVDLSTDRDGAVELKLYDLLGTEQRMVYSGTLTAGSYTVTLDGTGLTPGLYICELQSGDRRVQQTVLIAR